MDLSESKYSSGEINELIACLENGAEPKMDPLKPKYEKRLEALRNFGQEGVTAEAFANSVGVGTCRAREILLLFIEKGYAGTRRDFRSTTHYPGHTYYVGLEHAVQRAAPEIKDADRSSLSIETVFKVTEQTGSKRPAVVYHILKDIHGPVKVNAISSPRTLSFF